MIKQADQQSRRNSHSSRPTQAGPPSGINYQSGYQANGQGVNAGQAKETGRRAKAKNNATTQDGQRGVQDLQNGMTANFQHRWLGS